MAPRSIWNGTVNFGEVAVPVKLFSAVADLNIHFREVRVGDGCRITHRRVGVNSGREVPWERIAKAYETSRGQQVVLDEDEIAAARGQRPKVIEIEHFVDPSEINPVYYAQPYILGAQPGGERAYRVLLGALAGAERVGIGRFVLRTRERLVALCPRGPAMALYTMRFAEEVIDRADLDVPSLRRGPSSKEVAMAEQLIDTLTTDWRPSRHHDRHRKAVLALIERKAAGESIEVAPPEVGQPSDDLLAALEASLEALPSGRLPRRRSHRRPDPSSKRATRKARG